MHSTRRWASIHLLASWWLRTCLGRDANRKKGVSRRQGWGGCLRQLWWVRCGRTLVTHQIWCLYEELHDGSIRLILLGCAGHTLHFRNYIGSLRFSSGSVLSCTTLLIPCCTNSIKYLLSAPNGKPCSIFSFSVCCNVKITPLQGFVSKNCRWTEIISGWDAFPQDVSSGRGLIASEDNWSGYIGLDDASVHVIS